MGGRYGGNIRSKVARSAWQEPDGVQRRQATLDEIVRAARRGKKRTVFLIDDVGKDEP